MQSWGASAKFDRRPTGRLPTKSGVIGLLACALGIRRDDDEAIGKLANLRFAAGAGEKDGEFKEGKLIRDFHTAAKRRGKEMSWVTNRYYLSDALFFVGFEGNREFLEKIDHAVRNPAFPLFLGRRSCPPEGRVSMGICDMKLEEALKSHGVKKISIDSYDEAGTQFVRDFPISFNQEYRRFGIRSAKESEV
jgi:CRISPR system Cascade subunit CasD